MEHSLPNMEQWDFVVSTAKNQSGQARLKPQASFRSTDKETTKEEEDERKNPNNGTRGVDPGTHQTTLNLLATAPPSLLENKESWQSKPTLGSETKHKETCSV